MTMSNVSGASTVKVMNSMSGVQDRMAVGSVPAPAAVSMNAMTAAVVAGMAVMSKVSHHQGKNDEAPTKYGAHQVGLA